MHRYALIVLVLMLPSSSLVAQSATSREPRDGVMGAFESFAGLFGSRLKAAFDSIPASRYDYRPTPPQQTIGYIAQHLEGANYTLCERMGKLQHARTAKDALADTIKARWPKDTLVLPPSVLSPYVGVYELDPQLELDVTMRDGVLFVKSTGGATVRLWAESDRDFFLTEIDAELTFVRDARGAVTGVVVHQFGRDRLARKIRGSGAPHAAFTTDATTYLARRSDRGVTVRYTFDVISRFENRGPVTLYLGRCRPDSPKPLFTVALVEPAGVRSGYASAWPCVGHDRQFEIRPGDVRTDTLHVIGPNMFDGRTRQPMGVTEGNFHLYFDVRLAPGDGAKAAPDDERYSNTFVVKHSE
jgi:hypothetical protein